jgi:hypothetical protein
MNDALPQWRLRDCVPVNRVKHGPRVILPTMVGSPLAELTADHAEALAKELVEAAQKARRMPPVE